VFRFPVLNFLGGSIDVELVDQAGLVRQSFTIS